MSQADYGSSCCFYNMQPKHMSWKMKQELITFFLQIGKVLGIKFQQAQKGEAWFYAYFNYQAHKFLRGLLASKSRVTFVCTNCDLNIKRVHFQM